MQEEVKKQQNIYDKNKQYKWAPDTMFVMDGQQFGTVLNAVRAILNSAEAMKIMRLMQAHDAIEDVIKKSAEVGIIQEITEEDKKSPN